MLQKHWTLSKLKPSVAGTLALLLWIAIAAPMIHFRNPLQFHVGFAIPILLCAWTRSRRFLWIVATAALGMTIAKVLHDGPQQAIDPRMFYANRVIAVAMLLACALVAHMLIGVIETLEAEHDRMSTILATVPVGVTIADTQANTIRYNAAAARMLGVEPDRLYDLDEMIDRFARTERGLVPDRPRHGISRAIDGQPVRGLERDFEFPDGRKLAVLVSAAPLRDRANRIVGAVSGFVDITDQKTMQLELDEQRQRAEEATQRKSRFLAAVSHDIRTPANAISLLAELIERSATSPTLAADLPEIAHDLKVSSLSLVRLVSDVLDLTRFDSARVDLTETEFPLAELLDEECRQFGQQARDKGLEFICQPPPESLIIRADRVKLSRVINNLLGNAVKFTLQGSVKLEAHSKDDGCIQVHVSDTGPGIPPEHHQKIFDEYFQIKNPQREHEKGSGLGLAICQRLTEAMGANLTLDSSNGSGATFMLTLPARSLVHG